MNPFPDSSVPADSPQPNPPPSSHQQYPLHLHHTGPSPSIIVPPQPLVPQETNPFKLRIAKQNTGASSASAPASASPPRPTAALAPASSLFDPIAPVPRVNPFDGHFTAPLVPSQAPDHTDSGSLLGTSALGHRSPWDDVIQQPAASQAPQPPSEEWNLIDLEPEAASDSQSQPPANVTASEYSSASVLQAQPSGAAPDPLAPPTPPRHVPRSVDGNETYMVRRITWQDRDVARKSPILMQNANGPCPLVALVNALIISTPETGDHNLASILIDKEQISLNLLLQAVIHELLSKDSSPDSTVPDIGDLVDFLKGLHTGMNVNPRFLPTAEQARLVKRNSLGHVHPVERDDSIPGGFEDSPEMRFYSTFAIPLVHGWIPAKDSLEYQAMERSAPTFEAAQILMSQEDEMEVKLTGDGLSEEEQQTFQDLFTIKEFVMNWATQLTPTGLDVLTKSTPPNHVCILFRNDHFSTLYRHPDTLQLLSLVTDSGFASHDEVVWESLVDINGEQAEFFSGDFRIVSGSNSGANRNAEYDSVDTRPPPLPLRQQAPAESSGVHFPQAQETGIIDSNASAPLHSANEQLDNDLAFAIQLQEEENARHRTESSQPSSRPHALDTQVLDPTRNYGHGHDYRYASSPLVNQRGVPLNPRATAPRQLSPTPTSSPMTRRPVAATSGGSRNSPGVLEDNEDAFDGEAPPSYEQAHRGQAVAPYDMNRPTQHRAIPSGSGGGYRTQLAGPRQSAGGRMRDRECVVM
ncbi:Ubiquitin carboxyl-terminal hydrolase MIY1 [Ceratocystis lukuohia]|uniref:Ubiquitin carboxyl-terminal hydrolase MIY1 n=1 Tax=Ceratocystis lukuohia TaxID=2019550 RepID=A0ABR4MFK7_9PEZI